ncbi:MAG TPA: phosphate ABC transporter permease PstA [Mariprofundaceae bacterium]|nr:phosphate ABC transporter permease PstA [Mariprofundaceae bacterium]
MASNRQRRIAINSIVMVASTAAAMLGIIMLAWILIDVAIKGLAAINWSFFTELPSPPGMEGGGLGNAILGTFIMTAAAALMAIPAGVLAGTYLAEFGKTHPFANIVRSLSDILVSAPSIVIGVFIYLVIVKTMGNFSGFAGAAALAIIMLPVVVRTTEEMLRLVPNEMREAALALGSPYWRMMLSVIFRAAKAGMITGIMLAIARVAGETAPLLFTALNSPYWSHSLNEPMANLTVTLFNYAMSPYDDWHTLAWGAAFLITISVLVVTIIMRYVVRTRRTQ